MATVPTSDYTTRRSQLSAAKVMLNQLIGLNENALNVSNQMNTAGTSAADINNVVDAMLDATGPAGTGAAAKIQVELIELLGDINWVSAAT